MQIKFVSLFFNNNIVLTTGTASKLFIHGITFVIYDHRHYDIILSHAHVYNNLHGPQQVNIDVHSLSAVSQYYFNVTA